MTGRFASVVLGLFISTRILAATTNELSDVETQGRELARQLCEAHPAENFTNTGVLKRRDGSGKPVEIPIGFRISVTETNWQCVYNMHGILGTNAKHPGWTSLVITHHGNSPNHYRYYELFNNIELEPVVTNLAASQIMTPFAGSDFWVADLGLEFFHWPQQKILKHEMRRGRPCKVLESTNPNPSPNSYSRVVSWIDNETLGIVQAEAYDTKGELLKEFYPKTFKKVNGQWELQEMEIRNNQTGSRTRLEFDLKPSD